MAVSLRVKDVDALTEQMALGSARPVVKVNLIIRGPAADYALVWEWGRVDINPGPKTQWGTNPDGETRVLTKTAPLGFIRVNRLKYKAIIREEIEAVAWGKLRPSQWNPMVEKCLHKAAKRIAKLIAETAPIDTGQLREAIVAVTQDSVQETVDTMGIRLGLSA